MTVPTSEIDSARRPEDSFPAKIDSVVELERLLSEPTENLIEVFAPLDGDFIVLGVGGKLGPSLASMIRRTSDLADTPRRVIGVSRFSSRQQEAELKASGIEAICCDLLDEKEVERLPNVANVVFLAGRKFGSTGQEATTWATNTWLPAVVCHKFRRSRIVALSTGNVYGPTSVSGGGSRETDPLTPVGEYAMSCLGRERLFEFLSTTLGIRIALVRLNYACDLRYGVLVDLAQRVWAGSPIDLRTGYVNTIWQGDANAMILQCFQYVDSPPFIVNVSGSEQLDVREVCEKLGQLMNRTPHYVGAASTLALLSNTGRAQGLFGLPRVAADRLISWVADWIMNGRPTLGKPTGFESRDGRF